MPLAAVYDPVTNPDGPRCHAWDWAASIFGRTANDLSADPIDLRARETRDNIGVQYGLKAMLSGAISAGGVRHAERNHRRQRQGLQLPDRAQRLPTARRSTSPTAPAS